MIVFTKMHFVSALLFLTHLSSLVQCGCNINNVKFTAVTIGNENIDVNVNNCVNSRLFPGQIIKGLYARNQSLTHLYSNSISNMDKLETLLLDGCPVEVLEAGAFNNVPVLADIFIVKSNIQNVPYGVFNNLPSLRKLRLDNNRIQNISKHAFSNNLALKKVNVSHNELKYWDKDWFYNSSGVEKLIFEFNQIEKIPKYAFKFLPNVTVINFNYNNISVIERKAFQGIYTLKYLGLRYNRLSVIRPDVVSNILHIDSLFLDANKFNYLPIVTLFRLSVNNVTLDGNPWSCSCLQNVNIWLRLVNGKVKSSHNCKGIEILQCMNLSKDCVESEDEVLSKMYFDSVKTQLTLKGVANDHCVRLD